MRNKTVVILTCLRSCYCSSPWKRGWISLPAKVRGKQYQFVTTLLGTFSPDVPAEQTSELLAGTAVTIV